MEQWTLKDFKQPKVLSKITENENGDIELDDGYMEYALDGDISSNIMEAVEQSKSSDFWQELANGNLPKEHTCFFEELQEMGMIGEGSDIDTEVKNKQQFILDSIEEAIAAFNGSRNANESVDSARKALQQVETLLSGQSLDINTDILDETNFFSKVLAMQLCAWQRLCPPALQAASQVLHSILDLPVETSAVRAGIFPAQEIRRCLCALIWAITRSVDEDAQVKLTTIPAIESADHAINLGILAEKHALYSLEQLGKSNFLDELSKPENKKLLACAGYAQEYYITDRFIDLIAPGISKRLPRQLKFLLRRYYNEEVGHESFELKTCRALGMKKDDLLQAIPSPFGQLVCDLFSWLAHDEPLAYFSTISITEGLPGQRNPINEVVLDSDLMSNDHKFGSKQHEDLNFVLYHQQLPRWFLSECGVLEIDEQIQTMKFYNTMLEVSFRAWEELHRMHVKFQVPLNPQEMTAYIK